MKEITRNYPVPLYYQIKQQIIDQISSGELLEGQKLPSEHTYQQVLQVSRATVRQALNVLENEGFLERRQGIGTFIARRKIVPEINKLTSFSEDMQARGLVPDSRILGIQKVIPHDTIRKRLNMQPGERAWLVKRLRLADQEPMALQQLYIPPWIYLTKKDLEQMESYYQTLEKQKGLTVLQAQETLMARRVTAHEAAILDIEPGSPVLFIRRLSFDKQSRPVEYVEIVYRSDRYQYQLSLYR